MEVLIIGFLVYVIVILAYIVWVVNYEDEKIRKKENKMKKIFREEHIGQNVYSSEHGVGVIVNIGVGKYPVKVVYDNDTPHTKNYTKDGRFLDNKEPVLSFGTEHCYGKPKQLPKYTKNGSSDNITAIPITKGGYEYYRGYSCTKDKTEGYLIRYSKDKTFMVWMPTEQFYDTHVKITNKGELK